MPGQLRLLTLNDVKLAGRLTKDPEVRFTTGGTAVCRFRLAVGRRYKDRVSNEWKDDVAFVPCTVWRETAERCGQRLKKGSPVFIEGRLKSKDWETKEGQKRFDLEVDVLKVQFLESMGEAGGETDTGEASSSEGPVAVGSYRSSSSSAASSDQSNDDEVPF